MDNMKSVKTQIRTVALCVAVLFFMYAVSAAQGPAVETPARPSPRIEISETTVELGKVRSRQKVQEKVTLKNSGDAILKISKVQSSCGCTAAVPGKKELAPGESTMLDISFTAGLYPGKTQKTVTIHSNDPKSPATAVKVAAEVVTRATAEPSRLSFGKVGLGEGATMKLVITAADDEPEWKTVKVEPRKVPSRLTMYEIEPVERTEEDVAARRWPYIVSLKKNAPRGRAYSSLTVTINDETKPVASNIMAMATVEGLVSVTPPYASIHPRSPGGPATRYLYVRHREKKPFKITEITCDVEHIDWEVNSNKGAWQHTIKLSLKNTATKAMRGKLTITTNVPNDGEINVPVSASLGSRSRQRPAPIPRSRPQQKE